MQVDNLDSQKQIGYHNSRITNTFLLHGVNQ